MIVTTFSWIWAGMSALLWGFPIVVLYNRFLNKNKETYKPLWITLIAGFTVLTVYAEVFSLFCRVNIEANIGILAVDILVAVYFRKGLAESVMSWGKELWPGKIIAITVAGYFILLCASMQIENGDTYLYHAQAIHWISEYRVVKGLGNLHSRFAFNSAFLCLQTLFSVPFATDGVSLHNLNGLIAWIFVSYSVCSMKIYRGKRLYISDFARLALLVYTAGMANNYSAPGTDLFALGLSAFIICEWIGLIEEKNTEPAPYAMLCVLMVFDITLKLSTAMVLFLVLGPIYLLLKNKKWKETAVYIVLGCIVVFPFLARNYYISGWLVYPFNKIDLFNVDWKIPAETLQLECNRTLAGSREIYVVQDITLSDPFSVWFPRWLLCNGTKNLVLVIAGFTSGTVLTLIGILRALKKRNYGLLHISLTLVISIIYWYVSAPMIRYGKTYFLLLIFILLGIVSQKIQAKIQQREISLHKAYTVIPVLIAAVCFIPVVTYAKYERRTLNWPYPYSASFTGKPCDLNGTTFYIPQICDYINYDSFPAVPYEGYTEIIEMRGAELQDGFRTKEGVQYLF